MSEATKQPLLNRVVVMLLRSPLHRVVDRMLLVLTYTGRHSGLGVSLPVMYVRYADAFWIYVGWPERKTWWHNIGQDTPVTLRLRGRDVSAHASLLRGPVDAAVLAPAIIAYLEKFPRAAKSLGVDVTQAKAPDPESVAAVARSAVMVRCNLIR